MSWLANFEDGQSIGGSKCLWTDLPKNKRITGVQITHPDVPSLFVCLRNFDKFYFAYEAIANPGDRNGRVVAEILGGHDLALGIGTEIRMEMSGSVKVRTYPLSKFRFGPGSLHEGKKFGPPVVDTVPPESVAS